MEYCPYETAFDMVPKKKKRTKVDTSFLDTPMEDDSVYRPALGIKSDILSLQNFSEAFVDISSNITVPPVNKFQPLPKYFIGGDDDDAIEGFTDVIGSKETIDADISNNSVNINDQWKPVTKSNTYTAFYDTTTPSLSQLKNERKKEIPPLNTTDTSNDLVKKIDTLFKRLEALEKECKGDINSNNQKEILMFVGTGFIFLVGLHLLRR
jgi:hypothetical protein